WCPPGSNAGSGYLRADNHWDRAPYIFEVWNEEYLGLDVYPPDGHDHERSDQRFRKHEGLIWCPSSRRTQEENWLYQDSSIDSSREAMPWATATDYAIVGGAGYHTSSKTSTVPCPAFSMKAWHSSSGFPRLFSMDICNWQGNFSQYQAHQKDRYPDGLNIISCNGAGKWLPTGECTLYGPGSWGNPNWQYMCRTYKLIPKGYEFPYNIKDHHNDLLKVARDGHVASIGGGLGSGCAPLNDWGYIADW
ncbi:MAG: hypothetical protein KGZ25_14550, partial [Planctomycetes bacterium]|nr:hypothetical protein [Planctomycetota bacterium]